MGCRRTLLIGMLLLLTFSCALDPTLALPRALWAFSRELMDIVVAMLEGLTALMQQV